MADVKPEPKMKRWKLADPTADKVGLVNPFGGTVEVTNQHLQRPEFIQFITQIEAKSGNRIFGVLIVEA